MSDIAAHLVDRVLPDVPMRQWVLSVPIPVRYVMLRHRVLVGKVLAIFLRVVFGYLRQAARTQGVPQGRGAAILVEQKFGDGGRTHWHVHGILPDGVFHKPVEMGPPVFVHTPPPGRDRLAQMVVRIRARVLRLLRSRGLAPEDLDDAAPETESDPLGPWQAAALLDRVAVGPRAGSG